MAKNQPNQPDEQTNKQSQGRVSLFSDALQTQWPSPPAGLETSTLSKYLTRWISVPVVLGNTWERLKTIQTSGGCGDGRPANTLDRFSRQHEFVPHEPHKEIE